MTNYYDAHNHLQDERLGRDSASLVQTATDAGVRRMVVNGTREADWPDVLALAERYPQLVVPSFGYHPWFVNERSAGWRDRLIEFLDATPSAVGEIGLDRWRRGLPWEGQEAVFCAQLEVAAARNLPVSVHCLQAWGKLRELLEHGPRPDRGIVLHSFGGAVELVEPLTRLGVYFSLPGYFAHEGKDRQRAAFRQVPRDRLLIETDAPDQVPPEAYIQHPLPRTATGRPLNHPANLGRIYAFAAELLGAEVEALASQVEENFGRVFGGITPCE